MNRPKLTRKEARKHRHRKRGAGNIALPEYHHLVFQEIAEETEASMCAASLEAAGERTVYWGAAERIGTWTGEKAWAELHAYLDQIESHIRSIVQRHSLYYWIHLYRRVGVGLHELLDDDPEEMTVTLVRNILEVAFVRYGVIDGSVDDMGLSSEMSLEEVAGGLYIRKLRADLVRAQREPEPMLAAIGAAIRAGNAWLLKDFGAADLVDVARLESLAYEYWLTTARMRRVGKGGAIKVSEGGHVANVSDDKLEPLISSYDDRINKMPFVASSAGVAFYAGTARGELPAVAAFYNVERRKCSTVCLSEEMCAAFPDLRTNFLLGQISLAAFATAHSFAEKAYREKRGFALNSLCGYVSAIAVWALSSAQSCKTKERRLVEWKELYQRAYIVHTTDGLHEVLTETAKVMLDDWLGTGKHSMADDARLVHDFLTLAPDKRTRTGLWSLGPRYVFLPYGRATVVDLQALLVVLQNLFVGVSYGQGSKGTAFELEFRKYAADSGLMLLPERRLKDGCSERECDALIRCNTTLFVCECRAMWRPLDFEIGRVSTIASRTRDLKAKLEQAHTLAAFLRTTPKGTNYDFSWAENVVALVVSPFVEWIWDSGEDLWLDQKTPRVLSAEEAVRFMEAACQAGSPQSVTAALPRTTEALLRSPAAPDI
jgi:hypothetical protein